jgi:hypothetical protein
MFHSSLQLKFSRSRHDCDIVRMEDVDFPIQILDESLFPKTVVDSDKTMSPLVVFVELIDSPFPGKASLDVSYPS